MIVCQCQNITSKDIHAAIDWMRRSDPETLITPGKVYRALGKAADCGGCMPLFLDTMRRSPALEVPAELRGLRRDHGGAGDGAEIAAKG
ncbi:(2Fe-2S)-binding protein [Salibaculum sp.]|uniref:(2Fe-2S)-binding protein n=1 Tax=Salibaculum sp. TaxID=2855480 RepID=UPI002B49B3EC|nr:(2Fe-2S)-binding protein [Salibaculum sp.]HKL70359.1 (2Fe-2S)-binding protein [Salibaculum sp.]